MIASPLATYYIRILLVWGIMLYGFTTHHSVWGNTSQQSGNSHLKVGVGYTDQIYFLVGSNMEYKTNGSLPRATKNIKTPFLW